MVKRLLWRLSIPVRGNWEWVVAGVLIVGALVGGSWWDGP